jgi:hypothetical protein
MATCYYELRKQSAKGTDSLIADMMRHLHTREYLGKALIICDQPTITLSAARKQWLKLSRVIQKQRASTLNADKILKYTHAIAHMQHLHFSVKDPLEDPDSAVYFLGPAHIHVLPPQCFTVYITTHIEPEIVDNLLTQLPDSALIVDYNHSAWNRQNVLPKEALEHKVTEEWQHISAFLTLNDINIDDLSTGSIQDIEAMDDALDTLLGISHPFLQVANNFQRALETARPLRLSKDTRQRYDAFSLLAHRVQALSLENFTQRFLETYNEDDTFFLYEFSKGVPLRPAEGLAEVITYHVQAGRANLAKALHAFYMGRSFKPNIKPI